MPPDEGRLKPSSAFSTTPVVEPRRAFGDNVGLASCSPPALVWLGTLGVDCSSKGAGNPACVRVLCWDTQSAFKTELMDDNCISRPSGNRAFAEREDKLSLDREQLRRGAQVKQPVPRGTGFPRRTHRMPRDRRARCVRNRTPQNPAKNADYEKRARGLLLNKQSGQQDTSHLTSSTATTRWLCECGAAT